MRSQWQTHNGRRYLLCAFDHFGTDVAGLAAEIDAVDAEILRQPPDSVLLLVDLHDTTTSGKVVDLFKSSSLRTKGYVRRQAIIGIHGIQKMLAQAVAWFSRETFVVFDTAAAARDWLVDETAEPGIIIKGE
jgi:hypothetical protein